MSSPNPAIKAMIEALPALRTQGQRDAVELATLSLTHLLDSLTEGRTEEATPYRRALDRSLEALTLATKAYKQAGHVAEGEQTEGMKTATAPLTSVQELAATLIKEIEGLRSPALFEAWYKSERHRLDLMCSGPERNSVFDAIRARRALLREAREKTGLA